MEDELTRGKVQCVSSKRYSPNLMWRSQKSSAVLRVNALNVELENGLRHQCVMCHTRTTAHESRAFADFSCISSDFHRGIKSEDDPITNLKIYTSLPSRFDRKGLSEVRPALQTDLPIVLALPWIPWKDKGICFNTYGIDGLTRCEAQSIARHHQRKSGRFEPRYQRRQDNSD